MGIATVQIGRRPCLTQGRVNQLMLQASRSLHLFERILLELLWEATAHSLIKPGDLTLLQPLL